MINQRTRDKNVLCSVVKSKSFLFEYVAITDSASDTATKVHANLRRVEKSARKGDRKISD